MKKRVLIFLVISILSVGFLVVNEVKAGAEHNVYGWAWSENIGWISFNSTSGGGPINYGVHIDPATGVFSDSALGGSYAWSENIGWISFNSGDLVGCPTGTCEAKLDLNTYEVSGWARAYRAIAPLGQTLGGWDGWIRLNGVNGVTLDTSSGPPYEFHNWAWGGGGATEESAVVGWISFNDKNLTGSSGPVDYQVMTSLAIISPNNPPIADISCNPLSCKVYYKDVVLTLNNDSYDPDGLTDITKSEWRIKQSGSTYQIKKECPPYLPILCSYSIGVDVGTGFYTAKLYIEDSATNFDEATKDFQIKRDITAGFMCSLDNIIWQVCESLTPRPGIGDIIYLKDDLSTLGEYSVPSEEATIVSRIWKEGGVIFDTDNNNNTLATAFTTIELIVTDDASRTDSISHTIGTRLPLPGWKEIAPF